jgi:hypothetical protein
LYETAILGPTFLGTGYLRSAPATFTDGPGAEYIDEQAGETIQDDSRFAFDP